MAGRSDNSSTRAVRELLRQIHDVSSVQDSLYQQAGAYFRGELTRELTDTEDLVSQLQQRLHSADRSNKGKIAKKLADSAQQLEQLRTQAHEARLERVRQFRRLCRQVLQLLEADNDNEMLQQAARALGTIALVSPTYGPRVAAVNQRHKHLYKAILALLLLREMLKQGLVRNQYVLERVEPNSLSQISSRFVEEVQLPLIQACLLQDIGLQHPSAQYILRGDDGQQDPYRVLPTAERQALLEIGYVQCQRYLQEGLGLDSYIGNSRSDRDLFVARETSNQEFVLHLLQTAVQPQDGIGNLLKIPQVYASVVLPSKSGYQYEQIAKVSALLKAGVDKGWYPAAVVQCLLKITGYIPQGFGVTFIPLDSDKKPLDRYEYGIVNRLYPEQLEQPVCRQVTRNLTFNTFGNNVMVHSDFNLYFADAQQRLAKISEVRLKEILAKLASNFEERVSADLIPRGWHPGEFFQYSKHQNLWNRTETYRN